MVLVGCVSTGMYTRANKDKESSLLLSGTVETNEIQVGSKVGGRISEVLVVEGQIVKAGEPIVRFDISELLAERHQLEARIAQAEANLRKFEHGYRTEEIEQAEAAAAREMANLEA